MFHICNKRTVRLPSRSINSHEFFGGEGLRVGRKIGILESADVEDIRSALGDYSCGGLVAVDHGDAREDDVLGEC